MDQLSQVSAVELNEFEKLFTGHKDFHGVHVYEKETKEGVKASGSSFTKEEVVVLEKYKHHLEGKQGLGISPIDSNNNARFAVFDVDIYENFSIQPIQNIINDYGLPFNIFRTKSGGAHVYVFFSEDIKATKVRDLMLRFRLIFNFAKNIELFPKQAKLIEGDRGSWINLPYFNHENTKQYLYDPQGQRLSLGAAINYLKNRTVNLSQFKAAYNNLPFNDAPVCLQALLIHKDIDQRNTFLFDVATYLKAKHDNFESHLVKVNNSLLDPLPDNELHGSVIKSQERRTYSYRCKEQPMCLNCHKEYCEERAYGKNGDSISNLTFEDFYQFQSDPPYYKWIINGTEMTFLSESDLCDQSKFRDHCMRKLHKVPNTLKKNSWLKILERAFDEVQVVAVDQKDDISPGALFDSHLAEFLTDRAPAKNPSQILMNRVYKDKGCFMFRKEALIKFFFEQKQFRTYSPVEIQERIKKLGGKPERVYVNNRKDRVRVWAIPVNFAEDNLKFAEVDHVNFDAINKEDF
jgi:hypothetical protein